MDEKQKVKQINGQGNLDLSRTLRMFPDDFVRTIQKVALDQLGMVASLEDIEKAIKEIQWKRFLEIVGCRMSKGISFGKGVEKTLDGIKRIRTERFLGDKKPPPGREDIKKFFSTARRKLAKKNCQVHNYDVVKFIAVVLGEKVKDKDGVIDLAKIDHLMLQELYHQLQS